MNLMKRKKWQSSGRMSVSLEEGREEGLEEGRKEGERRIAVLYKSLLEDGRTEDLRRTVEDDAYRSMLCKEYGI